MALNSSFGEFITKEYGLLRQILSYLKPCDLGNAKKVCRDWNQAVESLTDKNPAMFISDMKQNTIPFLHKHKPILSDLVLYQPSVHPLEGIISKVCSVCPVISEVCACSLIGPDTLYILLTNSCESCEPYERIHASSCYRFCEKNMGLLLPTSEHINVSVFKAISSDQIFRQSITEETINQCFGGSKPVKGLLVLMRPGARVKWLDKILSELVFRQGISFAIGGGQVTMIQSKESGDRHWDKCDLVIITLRGDNVIAHSDILSRTSKPEIERFMDELGERVGPLPEGWTRIAFITQCVDRVDSLLESNEFSAFKKAFPSVPLFGMQAYGEFGIKSSTKATTENSIKKRRTNMNFNHSGTSSFLILTFKKV